MSTFLGKEPQMSKENIQPVVKLFFDPATHTAQYVIHDPTSKAAAIIDPVLNFDPASGATRTDSAQALLTYGREQQLDFIWVLETHAHADHLSAAHFLAEETGAKTAISSRITEVQKRFAPVFGFEDDFVCDGSQFDQLLEDGQSLALGNLQFQVWATPGHTPACMSYSIGDALFVGDTVFMPDYGSARADFPGGDAAQLFDSIQKLYQFPDATKMYLCHDYLPSGRSKFVTETSVGQQKRENIHIRPETTKAEFVEFRTTRDKTLCMPRLILPALQVNLRGGQLPPLSKNGIAYLQIPLNQF